MNEPDPEMYSDPALMEPVVPQEMRLCEIRHVFLRPNVAYIFTVDPNCKACVEGDVYKDDHQSAPTVR